MDIKNLLFLILYKIKYNILKNLILFESMRDNMANIEDYLNWRGDISFKTSPFNEVDNLVLAELAYIEIKDEFFKGMTIKDAVTCFFNKYTESEISAKFALSKNPVSFFKKLANSKRFGNLKIINHGTQFSEMEESQFGAFIIEIDYFTIYISFRGTDDSLMGWKEDFNMSFMESIPSQKYAANYVNKNVFLRHKTIYMGGHSKGGNLAVYAATNAKKSIKIRLKKIYNNDGPGFNEDFIKNPEYLKLLPKIETIVPETSIIGMLLEHKEEYKITKSDGVGLWQHDALSWQVENDHFITTNTIDETSSKINIIISDWLKSISKEERALFINTIYEILVKSDIKMVNDLAKLKIYKIPLLIKNFSKIDVKTRNMIIKFLKELVNITKKNFFDKSLLKTIKILK